MLLKKDFWGSPSNSQHAKTLGLEVPLPPLIRVDEVIE
jgi:hypothetical protein